MTPYSRGGQHPGEKNHQTDFYDTPPRAPWSTLAEAGAAAHKTDTALLIPGLDAPVRSSTPVGEAKLTLHLPVCAC